MRQTVGIRIVSHKATTIDEPDVIIVKQQKNGSTALKHGKHCNRNNGSGFQMRVEVSEKVSATRKRTNCHQETGAYQEPNSYLIMTSRTLVMVAEAAEDGDGATVRDSTAIQVLANCYLNRTNRRLCADVSALEDA